MTASNYISYLLSVSNFCISIFEDGWLYVVMVLNLAFSFLRVFVMIVHMKFITL